jgi:hypothetical protein
MAGVVIGAVAGAFVLSALVSIKYIRISCLLSDLNTFND